MQTAIYRIAERNNGWSVIMTAPDRPMETFSSREEAMDALSSWELGVKQASSKPDVWLVGNFVAEAGIDGPQLGEREEVDLRQYTVIREISQETHDAEVEAFFDEHGHYSGE